MVDKHNYEYKLLSPLDGPLLNDTERIKWLPQTHIIEQFSILHITCNTDSKVFNISNCKHVEITFSKCINCKK